MSDAATAVYHSSLADVTQSFDNTGGSDNQIAFLGAIATDGSLPTPIINGVTFDQSNAGIPEFTYLDDIRFATSEAIIPEPSTFVVWSLLVGLAVAFGCCKRRKR